MAQPRSHSPSGFPLSINRFIKLSVQCYLKDVGSNIACAKAKSLAGYTHAGTCPSPISGWWLYKGVRMALSRHEQALYLTPPSSPAEGLPPSPRMGASFSKWARETTDRLQEHI
jgi:hypothetical protein